MNTKLEKRDPKNAVHREFHNIRELLEMLMSEHTPAKHKIRMKAGLGWNPATDVYETETEFVVVVDIAGMDSRDISVFTDGTILTIQGVRGEIAPPGKKQFYKMEIQVGPFQRLIQIPVPVDSQKLSTNYTQGFLEIRLKRIFDDKDKKRKIKVE